MRKLGMFFALILVASTLTVMPAECYDSDSFRLIESYWGTDQETDVSPGDVATLTVVLRYEVGGRSTLRELEAYLLLPEGFEPVGGRDNVTAYYTGTISEGSLVKLEFLMYIPVDTAKGSYTANLHLYYSPWFYEPGDILQIPLEVTGKPIIDAKVLSDSLLEGEQQVLVELSNDGDAVAKNLKIVEVSSGSALAKLDTSAFLGDLEPGDCVTVPLSLFVPTGMEGKILSLAVEVSYLGPRNLFYLTSKTLQIRVEEEEEVEEAEIKITTKFPDVTVEAGKVVQYPTTIANLGDAARLLFLSIEPPADWKVVFKSGVLEVSRLYLEAGQSENLVIEATPPSTVSIGAYTIPVRAESENGTVYAEMELKATIVGSFGLGLELSTLLTSVTAGGSTSFTAKVTNTGYSSVTGIGLDISAPEDWEFSVSPVQIDLLRSRESFTFNVFVETPEDTVTGDYMITVVGLSDQVESSQVQVRFTATTPTEWGLYGVGVAVVFIVALVVVFVKFKRR